VSYQDFQDCGALVTLKVFLIGGGELTATDAFRTDSIEEAKNMALNIFSTSKGLLVYGDSILVVDAVAAIKVIEVTFIDLADSSNNNWLAAIDVFERFMEEQDVQQKTNRPRTAIAEPWFDGP
jgi:hypothetical protein